MMVFIVSVFFASILLFLVISFFTNYYNQKKEETYLKANADATVSGAEFPDKSFVDEAQNSDHPVPGRTYSSLGDWEKDTKVIWQKDSGPLEVEFLYEKWDRLEEKYIREHRSVCMKEIIKDSRNDFYLRGSCLARDDVRTFHLDRISSKILYNNRRYDPYEFIEKFVAF